MTASRTDDKFFNVRLASNDTDNDRDPLTEEIPGPMAKHTHDTNGNRVGPQEMTVGDEIVTYYKQYCSCGAYVSNDITNRRPK